METSILCRKVELKVFDEVSCSGCKDKEENKEEGRRKKESKKEGKKEKRREYKAAKGSKKK
jgi:hypothetical protein